jgi:hypothetical protein
MSETAASFPTNKQARLVLDPRDQTGGIVTLDANALTITKTSGDGSFGYNATTNGAVFFSDTVGDSVFDVEVDGEPGPGQTFLPVTVTITVTPLGAVSVGGSLTIEDKGTPA